MRALVALLLRTWLRLGRTALTMQECNALNAVALGVAKILAVVSRARRFVAIAFVTLGLNHAIAATWTTPAARTLRSGSGFV